MTRRSNWWLTGIGAFTALLFGTLAYVSYRAYVVRDENYYLVSVVVYGGIALFALVAIVGGWTNRLPGQRRQAPPIEAGDGDEAPGAR